METVLKTSVLLLLNKIILFNINKLWMEYGNDLFDKKPNLGNLGISILYYLIYIIIFIVIGTQILKRKEIK